MRILVAQMTRMGDMIQTTPLIRALRVTNPDAHITALVRAMSKTLCERNPDIDEVLVYDEDGIYSDLCAQDSDRLSRAYYTAEETIQRLRDGRFDICYNCTHSIASAMLFKLAQIPKVVGAHLSDDWQFVLRGRWVTYFFTSVLYRQYNALNLCDITRHLAPGPPGRHDLVFGITDEDRAFVDSLIREAGIGQDDFVVCFQMGASENKKRWTEDRFAELAKQLVELRQARILLLGVRDEGALGEALQRFAPGITTPLFGKTTIPQVGAILERAAMLVTNDTGTMHIAAAVRCPVVLVSIGHVHFRETGPYGPGHCAIERRREIVGPADWTPGSPDEAAQVRPDQTMRVVEYVLNRESDTSDVQMDDDDALSDVDVYVSGFAPDGCLEWYPLLRRGVRKTDFVRIVYRAMWLEFLREKTDRRSDRESIGEMLQRFDIDADAVGLWRADLLGDFEGLAELAQGGIQTTEKLLHYLQKDSSLQRAKETVGELSRLDEEIRLYGEVHEPCRPLVLITRHERDNLEGSDPGQLARTTLQIYRDLFARARLMARKTDLVAELMVGSS